MALEFLNTLLPMLNSASTIYNAIKQPQQIQKSQQLYNKVNQQAINPQPTAAEQMLLNPNDPRVQAMQQAEMQNAQGSFLGALRDVQTADQRDSAMGRSTYFDPERRDEGISFLMQRAQPALQQQSSANVYSRIQQALQPQIARQQSSANASQAYAAQNINDAQSGKMYNPIQNYANMLTALRGLQ